MLPGHSRHTIKHQTTLIKLRILKLVHRDSHPSPRQHRQQLIGKHVKPHLKILNIAATTLIIVHKQTRRKTPSIIPQHLLSHRLRSTRIVGIIPVGTPLHTNHTRAIIHRPHQHTPQQANIILTRDSHPRRTPRTHTMNLTHRPRKNLATTIINNQPCTRLSQPVKPGMITRHHQLQSGQTIPLQRQFQRLKKIDRRHTAIIRRKQCYMRNKTSHQPFTKPSKTCTAPTQQWHPNQPSQYSHSSNHPEE